MSNNLKVLADNRDALLLAEIASWLHMLGKLHEEFVAGDHGMDIKIPKDVKNDFSELYTLLITSWTGKVWNFHRDNDPMPEFQAKNLSIFDLIKYHRTSMKSLERQGQGGFLKLMSDAHGKGSSTEKGVLADFASEQETRVYQSTSLGYEPPYVIALPVIYSIRHFFFEFLETFLKDLREYVESPHSSTGEQEDNIKKWINFRRVFLRKIELSFRITVAETRRPLNDVTLFDQTEASVAFFKAAIAKNLLEGWREPYKEKNIKGKQEIIEHKYCWRFLRVGINGLEFLQNSVRVGDILARKQLIEDTLEEVKILLETLYPIGTEVYRDENGSVFIVPDIEKLHQETYVGGSQSLEKYIQDIGYKAFSGEATFTLTLGASTRNMLSFSNLVAQSITQAIPVIDVSQWQNSKENTCPVCSIRPQGPSSKALSRKLCDKCQGRRSNRSASWIKDLSSTIWIDEVADINGRLALLVAQFDMKAWLSGTFFNTILGFHPTSSKVAKAIGQNHLKDISYFSELTNQLRQGLEDESTPRKFKEFPLLSALVKRELSGYSDRQEDHTVTEFYEIRISGSDLEMEGLTTQDKARRLTTEMTRLSPSFSRISRVWQTTQIFWEDIVFDFAKAVGKVSPRLKIKGAERVQDTLGITHAYDFKVDSINLSVIYLGNGEFITADNLRRAASLLDPSKNFGNHETAARYIYRRLCELKKVQIEEPTGYQQPSKVLGALEITIENRVPLEETLYVPAIPILKEPSTFMVLVPADKALQVAKAIKKKYEDEIGKVRNRLPLTLGVVFAGARTPLPAILDAGRRMLKQPTEATSWQVEEVDLSLYPEKVLLTLKPEEGGGPSLTLEIPTIMGDTVTEDVWYPYWCLEKEAANAGERKRKFKGIDNKYWTHVSDLKGGSKHKDENDCKDGSDRKDGSAPQVGDIVSFMPSRLDFEFLDTAARRFEISYDKGKRRGAQQPGSSYHPARPYYLEQLDEFEDIWNTLRQGLETTQIHNLISIIENKRMEWSADQNNETFKKTVRDALNNAEWNSRLKPEQVGQLVDQLYGAALSGQLTDVVELYMQILHQKPKDDKSETGGNS